MRKNWITFFLGMIVQDRRKPLFLRKIEIGYDKRIGL